MKVLVIGSTGGSGRAAVTHLRARGHEVTAFARRPDPIAAAAGAGGSGLRAIAGDVLDAAQVDAAVAGHDAVVVTLGIRENALRVRLRGPAGTAADVRSIGTAHVVAAMARHGVGRLVVQTSYGVGPTRDRLRWIERLFFALVLAPQIADTARQQALVEASALDWVVVQPVHLVDGADDAAPFASTAGDTRRMKVTRASVGRFLAQAIDDPAYHRTCVAVSGAPAAARSLAPVAPVAGRRGTSVA